MREREKSLCCVSLIPHRFLLTPNFFFCVVLWDEKGKTICSLGIISGLQKLCQKDGGVGYLKPIGGYAGTDVVRVDGCDVDKVSLSLYFIWGGGYK